MTGRRKNHVTLGGEGGVRIIIILLVDFIRVLSSSTLLFAVIFPPIVILTGWTSDQGLFRSACTFNTYDTSGRRDTQGWWFHRPVFHSCRSFPLQ